MSEAGTLGIIGTGLIGASIGLRARETGAKVLGFDRDRNAAEIARSGGALDEIVSRDALYDRCETIVLAAPPGATIAELADLHSGHCGAALVIDVASVKEPILRAAQGLANFVGSHPLAGSERGGPAAASAQLFSGRPWLYVPPEDSALEARALSFIAMMGGRAIPIDASEHDRLLALTSHVPQLFATVFTKTVRQQNANDVDSITGPVARELLRIGQSVPEFWREIFAYNRENVASYARDLAKKLTAAANALTHESETEKHESD